MLACYVSINPKADAGISFKSLFFKYWVILKKLEIKKSNKGFFSFLEEKNKTDSLASFQNKSIKYWRPNP